MVNTVYNQDCLQGLKQFAGNSVDLIVTDPPYLMNYQSRRRVVQDMFDKIENDHNAHDVISQFFSEAARVLKDDSAIYVFCSWHHIDFFKAEFEKHFKLKNIIVWNKNNHGSGDLKGAYAPKHEFVLYGHKGRSLFRNKRVPDVIDCAKIPSNKLTHPTEKPTDLLDVFIQNNSDPGDLVLDAFAGTGATGVSAKRLGRQFVGFELSPEYAEIANKRIAEVKEYAGGAL